MNLNRDAATFLHSVKHQNNICNAVAENTKWFYWIGNTITGRNMLKIKPVNIYSDYPVERDPFSYKHASLSNISGTSMGNEKLGQRKL